MNICLMGGAPACIARISLDMLGNTVKHQPDKWIMKKSGNRGGKNNSAGQNRHVRLSLK
ncbi:hypothetical protein [Aeromonas sp. MdU4]|uniref:hypothetical protein n=1 Tax=Aeromonas sp. MdU4 TaxID=3342819 RepID=UPI0035B93B37